MVHLCADIQIKPAQAQRKPERSKGAVQRAVQDEMVLAHLHLAESIARSYVGQGRDYADLKQVASLGLIKAVRGFDPGRGVEFAAYAAPTISGEIKRYLRDACWVIRPPRFLQDLRTVVIKEQPRLAQVLGHEPSLRELAAALGESEKDVAEALNCQGSLRPESLEAYSAEGGAHRTESLVFEQDCTEHVDLLALRGAVRELPPGERELLFRRYVLEQTQQQIGDVLGMTQMRISRMLSRVLVKLARRLLDDSSAEAPRCDARARRPGVA